MGGLGTVLKIDENGWTRVKWDRTGETYSYRTAALGGTDLVRASGRAARTCGVSVGWMASGRTRAVSAAFGRTTAAAGRSAAALEVSSRR